ncbi:PAS domain-containing sensor histidine kinase [Salmonirosea aquatica]|uniref:histidine kinase n=1 Tax=Salmonirosea aquatica TaxID=2654236 RepID=A0A7C9BHX3_9BACT|nr:PAS domain S-box protein [Cytophagaceae bacterium SJW1-29]
MKVTHSADYIVQTMPCACLLFGDGSTIEFVNTFLCELLGYEAAELVGHKLDRILTFSSRLFYQTHFFPLLRLNGKVSEIFFMLRSKAGESIPVMTNATRDSSGKKVVNLCIFITVWERQKYESEILESKKSLQKALENNEQLKGLQAQLEEHQQKLDRQIATLIQRNQEYVQLNKVLSHDLQEPIRKIAIYLDILLKEENISGNQGIKAQFTRIQASVTRLRALTQSLQEFVSVESNEELPTIVTLDALIAKAKADAVRVTGFDDFELEVGEMLPIEARAGQMRLLFTELFKNAIQNRKVHARLRIMVGSTTVEENSYQFSKDRYRYMDYSRVEVTDNGKGFDNQYGTYVMGLFNKLDSESAGMGMGLALCKKIVSNHYGTLSTNSREGTGSTFIITLPVVQPTAL